MKALTALFIVLILAAPSVAADDPQQAQPGGDKHKTTFKKLDKDRNGTLSKEEAKTGGISEESFKQLDANSDNALDWQEFLALYRDDSKKELASGVK